MSTPDPIRFPTRRPAHKPNGSTGEAICPYCRQPISRKEFEEIRARIEAEERARIAKVEQALTTKFVREKSAVETQAQAAIAKAKKDAAKAAEKRIEELKANQGAIRKQATEAALATVAAKVTTAVNAEKLRHAGEKFSLEGQLADMQRRLQAKTAHQIGEPAEVDLFDALVGAFPQDRIERVKKGAKGPDILLEVVHQDTVVGKIVLDSKAVSRWSNKFPGKLRTDQLANGADFGVLVSTSFPIGAGELHLQDNIVVVSPARAVVLVQLLRRHLVETQRLRITGRARNEKAEALLAYIVSAEASDLIERLGKAAHDMIHLDVREVDQHQSIWRRRGELVRIVQKAHEDLTAAIDRIIDRAAEPDAAEEVAA